MDLPVFTVTVVAVWLLFAGFSQASSATQSKRCTEENTASKASTGTYSTYHYSTSFCGNSQIKQKASAVRAQLGSDAAEFCLNYRNKKVTFVVSLFENVVKTQFVSTYPTNKIWHMTA